MEKIAAEYELSVARCGDVTSALWNIRIWAEIALSRTGKKKKKKRRYFTLCFKAFESRSNAKEFLVQGHISVPGFLKCKGEFISLQTYYYFHVL